MSSILPPTTSRIYEGIEAALVNACLPKNPCQPTKEVRYVVVYRHKSRPNFFGIFQNSAFVARPAGLVRTTLSRVHLDPLSHISGDRKIRRSSFFKNPTPELRKSVKVRRWLSASGERLHRLETALREVAQLIRCSENQPKWYLILCALDTHHWKYPTSNMTPMYVLKAYSS